MDEPTTTTEQDLEGALRACQWDLLRRVAMIEMQIGPSASTFAERCEFALEAAREWWEK
jgi:hypothetical protein